MEICDISAVATRRDRTVSTHGTGFPPGKSAARGRNPVRDVSWDDGGARGHRNRRTVRAIPLHAMVDAARRAGPAIPGLREGDRRPLPDLLETRLRLPALLALHDERPGEGPDPGVPAGDR